MKAYLINLDRSHARLVFFLAQAERAGLTIKRIAAVDGARLSAPERAYAVSRTFQFQPINAGEVGLFMSHRLVWQALVDTGEAFATVFEDDAVLSPQLPQVLRAIERVQPPYDVIKLETTLRSVVLRTEALALGERHVLRPLCSWHGGTAGYVVSRAGAARLLEATWPLADPVDQVIFHPLSHISRGLAIAQVYPAVCVQKGILDGSLKTEGVFGTTIDRHTSGGRLFRHGFWIDLRRTALRLGEMWLRRRLARRPGHAWVKVDFDGPAV